MNFCDYTLDNNQHTLEFIPQSGECVYVRFQLPALSGPLQNCSPQPNIE